MGKNKLKKFSEIETISFVHQYPFGRLQATEGGFPLRGRWHEKQFGNTNPIVLELGCGKGEYTVGLARRCPDKNFIGIDIKGARMWRGATMARDEGLTNVAFLRTGIELLESFFAPGEVSEIWITFPDPQMKKSRKRLTSTRFMQLYRAVAPADALVRLKTDSPFLFTYTRLMAERNGIEIADLCTDIHGTGADAADPALQIRTHYEQQWMDRGLSIKYIALRLPEDASALEEPTEEIEHDTYRSYSRGVVQCPDLCSPDVLAKAGTTTPDK